MKKILTIIISALLICNISYSKDNPLIINIDSDKEIIAEFSN